MLRAEAQERDAGAWFNPRLGSSAQRWRGIAELGDRLPGTGHPGEITLIHLCDWVPSRWPGRVERGAICRSRAPTTAVHVSYTGV